MAPDHIAELALIDASRLQRYALAFAINDDTAQQIARDCLAEIARRDRETATADTHEREAA